MARVRELAGDGLTLAAARRVLALEDQISQLKAGLAAAEAESARLRTELAAARRAAGRDGRPRPASSSRRRDTAGTKHTAGGLSSALPAGTTPTASPPAPGSKEQAT